MAEARTDHVRRLMVMPTTARKARSSFTEASTQPCAGAHSTRPLPAIVKTIERRRGTGATMTNDFDYEATIASLMALALAAICWGVLIAPLAG